MRDVSGRDFLARVGLLHAAIVALAAFAAAAAGHPARGILLGGAAIGLSYLFFWTLVWTLVAARRPGPLLALAVLKIGGYLLLVGAAFLGRFSIEGVGFAVGVTSFLAAVLTATCLWSPRGVARTARA